MTAPLHPFTGPPAPPAARGDDAAAANRQQAGQPAAQQQQPRGGNILHEVQALVVGFFTSLLPGGPIATLFISFIQ